MAKGFILIHSFTLKEHSVFYSHSVTLCMTYKAHNKICEWGGGGGDIFLLERTNLEQKKIER